MYYKIYKGVRDGAWRCLADHDISSLPVDVMKIARLNKIPVKKDSLVGILKPDEQANSKIKDKFKNDSMGIINDYEYEYVIYVGDEKYMDMRISTVRQLSNQELSKLLDMLMDSVVVID